MLKEDTVKYFSFHNEFECRRMSITNVLLFNISMLTDILFVAFIIFGRLELIEFEVEISLVFIANC